MDFFSKLSKKASETYQFTKEKASNISEELKIKGKVNELKQNIEELYLNIGKTVYTELKDGKTVAEEEILEKCEQISKANDEISKLKDKLLSLKKAKTCPSCGAKLDFDDLFCSQCGKEQPKHENIEVNNSEPEKNTKEAEVIEVSNSEEQ